MRNDAIKIHTTDWMTELGIEQHGSIFAREKISFGQLSPKEPGSTERGWNPNEIYMKTSRHLTFRAGIKDPYLGGLRVGAFCEALEKMLVWTILKETSLPALTMFAVEEGMKSGAFFVSELNMIAEELEEHCDTNYLSSLISSLDGEKVMFFRRLPWYLISPGIPPEWIIAEDWGGWEWPHYFRGRMSCSVVPKDAAVVKKEF